MDVLSSDRPLGDPSDDRLGYAPFAKQLATSLSMLAPPDGLVMAVYGPWGSGKTTVLNFTKVYLGETTTPPVVVDFNPWWFRGHEDLTFRFFDQLLSVLNKRKVFTEALRKKLAGFAALVAEAPGPDIARGSGRFARKLLEPKRDAVARKDEIASELRKQDRRILVVMDDIDRLSTDEVRQLFQVIKAVADFPSVIYLLAFDKEVAIKALAETQGVPGMTYLEKIVQVPFELPLPDKPDLRRLLFERLNAIIRNTPDILFDQTHWANVYFEGVDHFISTPRNVVVLMNSLAVTYPAVEGEVNAVDFIAIEALRVFAPEVYDLVRRNPSAFVGHTGETGLGLMNTEALKTFHNAWISQLSDDALEPLKKLLGRLFPKLASIWSNTHYGSDWLSIWRRERRVCSPDVFPIYFRLAVPSGGISNMEMQAMLALTSDPNTFGRHLIELAEQMRPDGTTRVREVLERLQDYTEENIPTDHIAAIIEAILDVGDQLLLPQDDKRGLFDFGNGMRMERVMFQLFRRLDRERREEILKRAIMRGHALSIKVDLISTLGQQHGKYGSKARPDDDLIVGAEALAELEGMVLQQIRRAASDGSLLGIRDLAHILYRWRDWSRNKDEPGDWVQEQTADDDALLAFLTAFLSIGWRQSMGNMIGTKTYRLNPKVVEPFLDPAPVAERLPDILSREDIPEEQRRAAEQFLREYRLIEQGKDPNDPMFEDELEGG